MPVLFTTFAATSIFLARLQEGVLEYLIEPYILMEAHRPSSLAHEIKYIDCHRGRQVNGLVLPF
jgi:hypothetical protein